MKGTLFVCKLLPQGRGGSVEQSKQTCFVHWNGVPGCCCYASPRGRPFRKRENYD
jgi:hypothetical protein